MQQKIMYGRKTYALSKGRTFHVSTSIIEKAEPDENEKNFTERIIHKYEEMKGTIEIVLKKGRPDHAIIIFSQER